MLRTILILLCQLEVRNVSWTGKPEPKAEQIFAQTYPAIHHHFSQFREALIKRYDQGKFFWELRSCIYWQEFERSKIFIPAIAQSADYAADYSGYYGNDKTNICVTDEVEFILGILNSKVMWWFIQQTAASKQGGFYEFKPMYVTQISIPPASERDKGTIETLVSYILHLTTQSLHDPSDKLMLDYFEQLINALVYELYLPADLHAHNLSFAPLLQAEALPAIDDIPGDKLAALRAIFQRLYATDHPLRRHLFLLDTIPTIRIIEGKEA
ncbi:TaqI-like C-terminal specificity domain-containing protein [Leptodesmis sichuanensis]|uniref:TaqI-like C-terminal specificity domain-containing protein n=1 Tax=Leptodesmis sichuanensis TaxID=2906798 RepID=UPI001F360F4B|nr:TaqI-like C-terminal specificity domain-containing protein [Leptodesmis sichuanensis]UIE36932.1 hypothetical protein KIK02_18290 [Leptodesmis sichuanensis A121]